LATIDLPHVHVPVAHQQQLSQFFDLHARKWRPAKAQRLGQLAAIGVDSFRSGLF